MFVHQDGKVTGSAISMLNLIRGLGEAVSAHVVVPEEGPLCALLGRIGVPWTLVPFVRFWSAPGPKWYNRQILSNLKAFVSNPSVRQAILALGPDVVHLNDKACVQVGVSLRDSGLPVVQHLRSSYFTTHCWLNRWASVRSIKGYSGKMIAISEDEVQGFEGDARVAIVFNTVDFGKAESAIKKRLSTREKLGISGDQIVIGFTANISKIKGAWDFLAMATRLLRVFPRDKLRFIVAGNAPHPPVHRTVLQRLRVREVPYDVFSSYRKLLKDNLVFLGFQEEVLDVIAALDVMVIPTHLGALGRQPLEAMAVKTPVVVTSGHTGRSRIVLHEKTGLVVPMKDVKMLAQAVSKLIENPDLREQLSRQGYEYAKAEFNPAINARKVLQIYQDLTGINITNKPAHADH